MDTAGGQPGTMRAAKRDVYKRQEYALAREGYLRIDEADDTYNDLNRKIIDAYRERYGAAYLGRINYSGNQRQRIADGTESVFEAYTGQPLYNFCCDFCVSAPDRTLEELIRHWNNADVPLSEKKVDAIMDRIQAVSYTHLDVYKRQGLYRLKTNLPLKFPLPRKSSGRWTGNKYFVLT